MYAQTDFYSPVISVLQDNIKKKKNLEVKVKKLTAQLYESQNLYVRMTNALKLLSTVSDDNTRDTLNFITGMINKVLADMFPDDPCYIKLKKKLYGGNKPHIVVEILDSEDHVLDAAVQTGTGLNQVVSFMYVVCLIEIRKGRRLLIMDERLNGLHKSAKRIISSIIKIFRKGGFQFIFVEYSLNDIGKIYNVEKRGKEAKLVAVDGDYDEEQVYISAVNLNLMDKDYKEEDTSEEI